MPEEFKQLSKVKSVYLKGNPGSGKTFLMDNFYECLPIKRKLRLHYNEFMVQIH